MSHKLLRQINVIIIITPIQKLKVGKEKLEQEINSAVKMGLLAKFRQDSSITNYDLLYLHNFDVQLRQS